MSRPRDPKITKAVEQARKLMDGKRKLTLGEAAREVGLSPQALRYRLKYAPQQTVAATSKASVAASTLDDLAADAAPTKPVTRRNPRRKLESVLIVPDTHAPFHNGQAWNVMMEAAADQGVDVLVHIGDLWDCYAISSHLKDPVRETQLKQERDASRALRAELDDLKPRLKVFCEGNHEDRLRRHVLKHSPQLWEILTTDGELELTANGWEFVSYRDAAKIGNVYFTHDTGHSGKYTTSRALETFQHSVVIGHNHSMSYVIEGDAVGRRLVGCQFGWLGDVEQIDYMLRVKARRKWTSGFGWGVHDTATGNIHFTPVPIVDGAVILNGERYAA